MFESNVPLLKFLYIHMKKGCVSNYFHSVPVMSMMTKRCDRVNTPHSE